MFEPGSSGSTFWFVMTGKLEILVKTDNEFKYSKGIDENTFFGKKEFFKETRDEYAKVVSEKAVLIEL